MESSTTSTTPLTAVQPLLPALGETCANCGAPLASDQRYCLECGERRGGASLSTAATPEPAAGVPAAGPPPTRPRAATGPTVLAGLAVLLVALGVGVEIGRTSGSQKQAAAPPIRVVTVAGGAAGAAATATPAASATPTASPSGSATPAATPTPTPASSSGGGGNSSSNSTSSTKPSSATPTPTAVAVGSKGHGKGYQNGKFTGNFFGG